jgi:predicted aldo/keto reductase-like oxidoreductase
MGQEDFTRLVRYAYDQGIRFFETAEAYGGGMVPQMLGTALKGLPRDSYRLMTKYSVRGTDEPQAKIDRFRKDLNSDQIDILLIHAQRSPKWPDETKRVQDAFSVAKSKKIISAHGASIHGLQGLSACPGNQWLDVALLRLNHAGVRMDTPNLRDTDARGDVNQVVAQAKKIRGQETGILGMKLIGEGQFTKPEDREASIRFVMGLGVVDAVTIGFTKTKEIDEAIVRINRALNA